MLKQTLFSAFVFAALPALAADIVLSSQDIHEGESMHKRHVFNGFGCSGDNMSPHLQWQNLPAGTQSVAITAYDPDAPTGSGWWHWLVIDMPASVAELPRGADISKMAGRLIRNDYGSHVYGGACPPPGHGMHRYQFTLWALPVKQLTVGDNPSAAVVGYLLNQQALGKKTLTATYHQ